MSTIRDAVIEQLNGFTNLPSMNETVRQVQEMLSRNGENASSASAIGKVIEKDLGLSAKLLKIANSVYYAGKYGQIGDVGQAVARLGMAEVSRICTVVGSIQLFSKTEGAVELQEFWKHSLGVALVMRHIAGTAPSMAACLPNSYIAGLFHDIGILVLDRYFSNIYKVVLQAGKTEPLPLFEIEEKVLGIDHGEISGFLCRKWKLPKEICCAVAAHHNPDNCGEQYRKLAQLINITNFTCSALGIPEPGDNAVKMGSAGAWHDLGLDNVDLASIAQDVKAGIEQSGVFVSMSL